MNQILVEGGFAPEWIMLKRDIIHQQNELRKYLHSKCEELLLNYNACRNHHKSSDMDNRYNTSLNHQQDWNKYSERVEKDNETLKSLNKNIDKYNLIVPMMKSQMFHFNLKKESDKIYGVCVEKVQQDDEKNVISDSNELQNNANLDLNEFYSNFKGPSSVLESLLTDFIAFVRGKMKGEAFKARS